MYIYLKFTKISCNIFFAERNESFCLCFAYFENIFLIIFYCNDESAIPSCM